VVGVTDYTKICTYFITGKCNNAENCNKAHIKDTDAFIAKMNGI